MTAMNGPDDARLPQEEAKGSPGTASGQAGIGGSKESGEKSRQEGGEKTRQEGSQKESLEPGVLETLAAIKADRQAASTTISGQVRAVALGTLALVWVLLNGSQENLTKAFENYSDGLIVIAAWAVVGLLLDLLQYVVTFWCATRAYRESEFETKLENVGYTRGSWLVRIALALLWTKVVVVAGSALWLIVTIGVAIR